MELYQNDEDEGIRLMVEKYQNYVWHVITVCYPTFSYENADMFQCGVIGIIVAMQRYSPDRGTFSTYCTPYIKKELSRHIRYVQGESSAYYAEVHNKITRTVSRLEAEGLEASVENIMNRTGYSRKIVARELKVNYTRFPVDVLSENGVTMRLPDQFVINDILAGIPLINQMVVRKKAVDNMPFHKIAREMGMSIFHVRKVYLETIEQLRVRMS